VILTGSQVAVAILAVRGLTNRQIADRLGWSVPKVGLALHYAYFRMKVANRQAMISMLYMRLIERQPPPFIESPALAHALEYELT
jgi:DNA-binding NarL/FixJ family response regulator